MKNCEINRTLTYLTNRNNELVSKGRQKRATMLQSAGRVGTRILRPMRRQEAKITQCDDYCQEEIRFDLLPWYLKKPTSRRRHRCRQQFWVCYEVKVKAFSLLLLLDNYFYVVVSFFGLKSDDS